MRPRQPREQARPVPEGPQGPAHPRARRDRRAAGEGGRHLRRGGPHLHRVAGQPLRARRRKPRRLPRRAAREVPRPHLRPGPLARPVRGHDGGDRRVRPARALPVGGGVPGPRRRRLRPHARTEHVVAQQHHLPRHRGRVRRQDVGSALARARAGRRTGRAGLVRADPAARVRGARRRRRPAARPRRRRGPSGRGDPAHGPGGGEGGERRRRAGGHEPLRDRPAAARLPAAHHGALRDLEGGRLPGAPGGSLRRLPRGRRAPRGVRGEAHGVAGGGAALP